MEKNLPYEILEDKVVAKWDKSKKNLRVTCEVCKKAEEKLELPFKKIEYEGIDEDDENIESNEEKPSKKVLNENLSEE